MENFIVSYDLPFRFYIYGGTVRHSYLDLAIRKNVYDCIKSFEKIGIKNVFLANESEIKEFDDRLKNLSKKPIVWNEFINNHFSRFNKDLLKKEFKILKNSKKKLFARLFYYDMKTGETETKAYKFEVILPNREDFNKFLDKLKTEGRLK